MKSKKTGRAVALDEVVGRLDGDSRSTLQRLTDQIRAQNDAAFGGLKCEGERFHVGDVVRLKSGGANWTVTTQPSSEQMLKLGADANKQWTGIWLIRMGADERVVWMHLPAGVLELVSRGE